MTVTDELGQFSLDVAPHGNYSLRVNGGQAASPEAFLPDNFLLSGTVSVTADTTYHIIVNAVELSILARDNRDVPVPDAELAFSSSGSQGGFSASSSGSPGRPTTTAGRRSGCSAGPRT